MGTQPTQQLADVQRHLNQLSAAEPAVLAAHLHTSHGVTKPTAWTCLLHFLAHLAGAR